MPIVNVKDADHAMLAPYHDLRGRNLTSLSGRFIAESPWVVERLLLSSYAIESALVSERMLDRLIPLVNDNTPVLCAPEEVLRELVGFAFHRGVLACGLRKKTQTVAETVMNAKGGNATANRWLAVEDVVDQENIGGLLRTAGALGVHHIILTRRCADPFSRQALRVAMGVTFRLNLSTSACLATDLAYLRNTLQLPILAAAIGPNSIDLKKAPPLPRGCIVLGSEGAGLRTATLAGCDFMATIPMAADVDSLNVVVAGGVFMHHLWSSGDGANGTD